MKKSPLFIKLIALFIFVMAGGPVTAYEVTVRVGLLMDQPAVGFKCEKPLSVKDGYTLQTVNSGMRKVVIKAAGGKILLGGGALSSDYVYVVGGDFHTPVYLNGVPYRGYFLVGKNSCGRLMVVNHVGMEDYLGGVLGGEINASWPLEAIKAQAVAARSYALYKLEKSSGRLYDLVNNTADQMYLGVRGESARFNTALQQTRSQVLSFDGNVLCAYYHSNSGGHTSDSMQVFHRGSVQIRGVSDPFSHGAPNSTWAHTISGDNLRWKLTRNGYPTGKIFAVKPSRLDSAGRVAMLSIEHEKGTTEIHGSDFRRILGYRELKSTRLTIHPSNYMTYRYTKLIAANRGQQGAGGSMADSVKTIDFRNIPTYFTFRGSGWGHGVGMSQWGAKAMAERGYTYKEILGHYYAGCGLCIAEKKQGGK